MLEGVLKKKAKLGYLGFTAGGLTGRAVNSIKDGKKPFLMEDKDLWPLVNDIEPLEWMSPEEAEKEIKKILKIYYGLDK